MEHYDVSMNANGERFIDGITDDLADHIETSSLGSLTVKRISNGVRGVLVVTPGLLQQLFSATHGEGKQTWTVKITVEEERGNFDMANLYRVPDSTGERHIVAADSESHARELVTAYCKAVGGGNVENAQVQYLGSADLVASGSVLSGEDENAEPKPGTPGKK